jgi:hypothetical protein
MKLKTFGAAFDVSQPHSTKRARRSTTLIDHEEYISNSNVCYAMLAANNMLAESLQHS